MARIRMGQRRSVKSWREFIVDQIKIGKVTPILSNSVFDDLLLGGHEAMVRDYAAYLEHPWPDQTELAGITQFVSVSDRVSSGTAAIKSEYLTWIKSRLFHLAEEAGLSGDLLDEADSRFDELNFGELCKTLGYPRFGEPHEDPLLILAQLPLPVYMTTSYHTQLEEALRRAGKNPVTVLCGWSPLLRGLDLGGDHHPTVSEPMVFHLHGLDSLPQSLVLTENDYMEFLVAVTRDEGRETDLIPARVRHALVDSSLILMGFNPESWDFRSLFWGLLQSRPMKQTSVTVLQTGGGEEKERYLRKFLGNAAIEIYSGAMDRFARELMSELGDL